MSQENQNVQEEPHKRRVRYKGKYPRNYKEKYKELNPEKYQDTIEKVIRKGSTPAGMHISIMVREIIDFLQIKPGQTGFDATLGYGGHTKAMMECLKGQGHMYATDVDPIESAKTKKRLEILNKSNDGFYIANEDLRLRGPGDLFGIRQSGELAFRIGDVFQDAAILQEANDAANDTLQDPSYPEGKDYAILRQNLEKYMYKDLCNLNL
mgnify:FL=1